MINNDVTGRWGELGADLVRRLEGALRSGKMPGIENVTMSIDFEGRTITLVNSKTINRCALDQLLHLKNDYESYYGEGDWALVPVLGVGDLVLRLEYSRETDDQGVAPGGYARAFAELAANMGIPGHMLPGNIEN